MKSDIRYCRRLLETWRDAVFRLAFSSAAFSEFSLVLPQCVWDLSSAISLAVLYFDYALTFGMEVERFWKREFSTASFGFFLNRYLAVFAHIPIIYEFFGPQTPSVRILL